MSDRRKTISDMIEDLIVLDFHSENLSAQITGWKRRAIAPYGQNCRRNLYYGFCEDFVDFPFKHLDRTYTERRGVDAYAHILKFACGFERGYYNHHNRFQFFQAWASSTKDSPETGEKYSRLVNRIDGDTKFMQKHIYSHHKAHNQHAVARDLSGMKKGDEILIVGDVDSKNNLSPYTNSLIKTAESKQPRRKGFITVTHPDPEIFSMIKEKVREADAVGKKAAVRSGINFVDFDDLAVAIEVTDQLYVAMPMGAYEKADEELVMLWQGRGNRNNTLTHMHSDIDNKGQMTPLWKDARLDKFINVHHIREEMAERGRVNSEIIAKMESALWHCAELRAKGKPLTKNDFFGKHPDLVIG